MKRERRGWAEQQQGETDDWKMLQEEGVVVDSPDQTKQRGHSKRGRGKQGPMLRVRE